MGKYFSPVAALWLAMGVSIVGVQEFRGSITGRVVDPSHSVVPNAKVEVRNPDTNEMFSTVTDAGGNYTVLFVRPGSYAVRVEAAGFKRFVREPVTLNVGQAAAIEVVLEVGAPTEQITVSAEAPLLEAVKADRGAVDLVGRERPGQSLVFLG